MTRRKKGSVGIFESSGRLYFRWRDDGKQQSAPTGLAANKTNRALCEKIADRMTADRQAGIFDKSLQRYAINRKPGKDPSLLELWKEFVEHKAKTCAPATMRLYRGTFTNHVQALPSHNLTDAFHNFQHIERVHTPEIASRLLTYLNSCCRWAVMSGRIASNPFEQLKYTWKKKRRSINPFTLDERDAILKALRDEGSPYADYIEFLFRTGCRPGEAAALTWKNVSGDEVTFRRNRARAEGGARAVNRLKTQDFRNVPVDKKTKALLEKVKPSRAKSSDLVFPAPRGGMINPDYVAESIWYPALEKLGLEARTLYHTRHTAITAMLRAGMPVEDVAKLVGNSPEMIYKHYAGHSRTLRLPEL